ncbi:hypothetical protein GH714_004706 [Hevea brasiliensis]|uniref:Selenoprotein F n=1 Tax=Hevea brasiliensis TaxID=3981 RepID=A0A6A6N6X7_HEVBR|nr:hypothetical protein GH714_004706 [Hevea brasiliensis]
MGSYRCCVVVLWVAVILQIVSSKEQLSSRECEDLGFTGLALCSDCNTFAEYVKNQELVSDCLKCCTEDSDDSMSKITYSGAVLEVCMRKLVFYPEIVGFIEEEKDKFPTVKVQYIFNSPPKLIMLDDEGSSVSSYLSACLMQPQGCYAMVARMMKTVHLYICTYTITHLSSELTTGNVNMFAVPAREG